MKTREPMESAGQVAIPLTRGKVARVDMVDVHAVSAWNWHALWVRDRWYAARTDKSTIPHRKVLMHRVIMGEPEHLLVDHKDGDGLNNARSNLRTATHTENACNRGAQRNNSSGRKGVTLHRGSGRWQAQIQAQGKAFYLGLFDTPDEAGAAYEAAAGNLHKRFARTK